MRLTIRAGELHWLEYGACVQQCMFRPLYFWARLLEFSVDPATPSDRDQPRDPGLTRLRTHGAVHDPGSSNARET
jgi:hypothetical protein